MNLFVVGQFIRKTYRLRHLGGYEILIPNGIRTFICDKFKGMPVSGSVQRRYDSDVNEQVVWVWITALPDLLATIERDFLYDFKYWESCEEMCAPTLLEKCSHQFVIKNSPSPLVECGPGSDHKHDYKGTPVRTPKSSTSNTSKDNGAKFPPIPK